MAKPVVDGLEEKMQGRMAVTHVDINDDAGRKLAMQHRIRGVPAFILLDAEGGVVYRKLGGKPDVAAIERHVADLEAKRGPR